MGFQTQKKEDLHKCRNQLVTKQTLKHEGGRLHLVDQIKIRACKLRLLT